MKKYFIIGILLFVAVPGNCQYRLLRSTDTQMEYRITHSTSPTILQKENVNIDAFNTSEYAVNYILEISSETVKLIRKKIEAVKDK